MGNGRCTSPAGAGRRNGGETRIEGRVVAESGFRKHVGKLAGAGEENMIAIGPKSGRFDERLAICGGNKQSDKPGLRR